MIKNTRFWCCCFVNWKSMSICVSLFSFDTNGPLMVSCCWCCTRTLEYGDDDVSGELAMFTWGCAIARPIGTFAFVTLYLLPEIFSFKTQWLVISTKYWWCLLLLIRQIIGFVANSWRWSISSDYWPYNLRHFLLLRILLFTGVFLRNGCEWMHGCCRIINIDDWLISIIWPFRTLHSIRNTNIFLKRRRCVQQTKINFRDRL